MAPPLDETLPPGPQIHQIQQLVQRSLQRYGRAAAEVTLTRSPEADAWFVEVTPRRYDAAPVALGVDLRGSLLVTVANTSMDDSGDDDLYEVEWLRAMLDNVFAGRVEEIGRRSDSYVRIGAGRPDATSFGAAHLPIPWMLRRVRRFTAYS